MKKRRMRALIGLLVGLELALLALPNRSQAYSNAERDGDWRTGGPHRTIIQIALTRYFERAKSDDLLSKYDFTNTSLKLSGVRAGAPDLFRRSSPSDAENQPETFQWWVIEGGYSADEPELYASFRHFYDPRAADNKQPAYLTDHLDQVGGYFRAIGSLTGNPITEALINEIGRNPEVNAKDWAIDGTAREGWGENEYSWKRGVQYVEKAFASTDAVEKSKLFAQGWRALGETMHLLADMTTPAHVRNDSHPAIGTGVVTRASQPYSSDPNAPLWNTGPNVGMLKGDPYEFWVQAEMVQAVGNVAIDQESTYLTGAQTTQELFHQVAGFANANFFSADTIAGKDELSGAVYRSANGMADYATPRLEQAIPKNGSYVVNVFGRPVCLARQSWLAASGWGPAPPLETAGCVESQAKVLVPLAIAGDAKLADWFVPRMRVEITSADTERRLVQGKVTHMPQGAYTTAMSFSTATKSFNPFRVNGSVQDVDDYQVTVKNGLLSITYGDATARRIETAMSAGNAVLSVQIDIGGIYVRSNDFALTKTTPTLTRTASPTVTPAAGAAGAWVLKLVQTNVAKTEANFSDGRVGYGCTGGGKVSSTETGASISTSGGCPGAPTTANEVTQHTWTRPPDKLLPGREWTGALTASGSGRCYFNTTTAADEQECRDHILTNHLVYWGDGWPGTQKEFKYDHGLFATTNRDQNSAIASDRPRSSFKYNVPAGSVANTTLVLQFVSKAFMGQVYTNFWYAWDANPK